MFLIKQGDRFPDLTTTVRDENGDAVDLTDATLTFSMRKARDPDTVVVDAAEAALVNDGAYGEISYAWGPDDTEEPGTYEAEFHITPQAGDKFRVPTDGYIAVVIEERVGT